MSSVPVLRPGAPDAQRLWAFRRLVLESTLAEITQVLDKRGVQPLLLKGAAFAHWLYDDPRERTYGDIDLLVGPDRFEAAVGGLVELKFEPRSAFERTKERASHHEQLRRGGTSPVEVELHHTLRLVLATPSILWQRLTEAVQTIEVAGTPVKVPSPSVSAVIVALHAAQHGDRWLPPLHDLQRALDRVDLETWRAASALARELGAGPAFAAGLRLVPTGCEVAGRLGLGETTPRVVRLLAAVPPNSALGLERLISTPGATARLRLLASELVPSGDVMRDSSALARRGEVGLVIAHLWRPFQRASRVRRGVQVWLRAAVPALSGRRGREPR